MDQDLETNLNDSQDKPIDIGELVKKQYIELSTVLTLAEQGRIGLDGPYGKATIAQLISGNKRYIYQLRYTDNKTYRFYKMVEFKYK